MRLPLFAQRQLSSRVGEGVKGVKGVIGVKGVKGCSLILLSRLFRLPGLSAHKKKDAPLQGIL